MEKDIKKLYTSPNSTPFRSPWTKFHTYNLIGVGEDRFQVKIGVLQQHWDMGADKIRAAKPIDTKLTFSENLKTFQKNVYFYPSLMYNC